MAAVPTVFTSLGDFTVFQLLGAAAQSVTATTTSATLNAQVGQITTTSLTTGANTAYTFTLSNSLVKAGDIVLASVANGTNSAGIPNMASATTSAGQVVFVVDNASGSASFNGTLVLSYVWIPFL